MNDNYKLYTSYKSLNKKIEKDGIKDYIAWLSENKTRVNKSIKYSNLSTLSPLCIAVKFHNLKLIKFMLKNGCNIDGIMDDSVSYYTPLSAIYLIDIYYIRVNLDIKNKLQILNRDNKIKLLKIKIEIFDLLVLNGADTNLLGLNGKNLLGLELGKPLSHINNKFISYIISKGMNPNYNNFVTNKEIPLSFDNNSWFSNKKVSHFFPKNTQALELSLVWSVKPIIILYWSIIVTSILILDDGKGDIFGLYLDISSTFVYIQKICLDLNSIISVQDIKNKGFQLKESEIIKNSVSLLNILINNGTNLKDIQSTGKDSYETMSWFTNGKTIINNIIKNYKIKKILNKIFIDINRPIHKILKKHAKKDITKIELLASLFKISLKNCDLNDKETRKYICNTIIFLKNNNKLNKNFKSLVLNLNNNISNNTTILTGDNVEYYSKDELVIYSSNIIKGVKRQKINYCFHISELPDLIRTGINPYNRSIFSYEKKKEFYSKLGRTKISCNLVPISFKELHQFNFDQLILSRTQGTLCKNILVNKYNYNYIPNFDIRMLYKKYNIIGSHLNNIVSNIIRNEKTKFPISLIINSKQYIKEEELSLNKKIFVEGYGIYKN